MGTAISYGHHHHHHHHHHGYTNHLAGKTVHIHKQRYKLLQRLGSGAFGTVYSAQSPDGSSVAVKVIDLNIMPEYSDVLIKSYLNEVKNLQRLRQASRHVVRIFDFDFDFDSGRAYIVMEKGGENLTALIDHLHYDNRNGKHPTSYINPTIRKEIWRQLVSVVNTLTQNNIVHMDLKPDNIILFGRTLKIVDLGISKKPNMFGQAGVGTPQFSAPEVMYNSSHRGGYYGTKADVWSLGAILYLMTYGEPPEYSSHPSSPPRKCSVPSDRHLADMLRRTLVLDPKRRIDIRSILAHPYTKS